MKLHAISVSQYRSISSAKRIRLGRSTVLIGPNNEGKSNILRGLVLAMTILTRGRQRLLLSGQRTRTTYNVRGYDWEKDYPINLQKKNPNGETEIILEFALEDKEYEEFSQEVNSKITGNLPIRIGIGGNGVSVTYHKKGKGSATLSKKSAKIADFVSSRIEFEHIPAVRTAQSAQNIVSDLVSRELLVLEANPDYKKALQKIAELQKPILETLSGSIYQTLKKFLPQVKKVKIELPQSERMQAFRRGTEISVDDGTMTPLQYKGDGVQSLAALGIIRHASDKSAEGKKFVIAIEEPESHLHPNAIHELKEVIDKLSEKHQIIITSHNPLFVDRRAISNNVIVNERKAKPAKNVEEIRKILGVRASDNLRNAEMVLVVEGEDDIISLKSIIQEHSEYLNEAIENGSLAFDSLNGGTNLSYKLSLLRDAICLYHVFIDDDRCGRESYNKAKACGLLEDGQINLAKARGRNESEIEDLFAVGIYKTPIENKYHISFSIPQFRGKKKWSDRVKDVFDAHGKPWDDFIEKDIKYIVAKQISLNPGEAINAQDKLIIESLIGALEKRLKEKEKAQQDASLDG
jgi:putative ATP-dependent endonuclease of the OLD family